MSKVNMKYDRRDKKIVPLTLADLNVGDCYSCGEELRRVYYKRSSGDIETATIWSPNCKIISLVTTDADAQRIYVTKWDVDILAHNPVDSKVES